jgi:peptide deformylase
VLRQRAADIAAVDDDVRRLVDDLFETMYAARGVGLAGNQIGVARRVAVVDVGQEHAPPLVLVNPVLSERAGSQIGEEGCLSIPELYGEIGRAETVVLDALDRAGQPYQLHAAGFLARAIQHEVDHLDGILFIDHLSAVKRDLLLAKWKKARKGKVGYTKEVTPEPAGER